MSHYGYLFFAALVVFSIALSIYGAYQKGCRDAWRASDEITQVEPVFPPEKEPQPIEIRSPLHWPEMLLTTNCPDCQSEREQAL